MKEYAVAERYAKAFYELASQKKAELAVEKSLRAFLNSLKVTPRLGSLFENPVITIDEKKIIIKKAAGESAEALLTDFLTLLVIKGRFSLLEPIAESYHRLLNASKHFEEVTITTAKPLRSELKASLEKILEKKIGEKIISETKVDPALLGGMRIQIRHRLFDGSVRTKLDDLKLQMAGVK